MHATGIKPRLPQRGQLAARPKRSKHCSQATRSSEAASQAAMQNIYHLKGRRCAPYLSGSGGKNPTRRPRQPRRHEARNTNSCTDCNRNRKRDGQEVDYLGTKEQEVGQDRHRTPFIMCPQLLIG